MQYEKDSNHSFDACPVCVYCRFFEFWADEICVSSLAHSVAGCLSSQYGICISPAPAWNHPKTAFVLKYGAEALQHSRICRGISGSSAAQYYGHSSASVSDAVRLFPAAAFQHVWNQRHLAELSKREIFAGRNRRQHHSAFFLLYRCHQCDLLLCTRKKGFAINSD